MNPYTNGIIWKNLKYIPLALAVIVFIMMLISTNTPTLGLSVQCEHDAVLRFLCEDTTDTNEYLGDDIYDCEDFAIDTQVRAKRHGLSCAYVRITAYTNASNYHAIIAFRVDNKTIFFEPQNDMQIYPSAAEIYSITWDDGQYSTRANL